MKLRLGIRRIVLIESLARAAQSKKILQLTVR